MKTNFYSWYISLRVIVFLPKTSNARGYFREFKGQDIRPMEKQFAKLFFGNFILVWNIQKWPFQRGDRWGCRCPYPQINVPFLLPKNALLFPELPFYFQTCPFVFWNWPFVFQKCLFVSQKYLIVFQNCSLLFQKFLLFIYCVYFFQKCFFSSWLYLLLVLLIVKYKKTILMF